MPETWKYLPFPPGPETETGYRNLRATTRSYVPVRRPPMGFPPHAMLTRSRHSDKLDIG